MWWCYLYARLFADPLMAWSGSQQVSDVVIWMQDYPLTILHPCSVPRLYVMWLFEYKTGCWSSHGLVLLLASMQCCYLDVSLLANLLTVLSHSQIVCDVAIWMQDWLLTLSLHCPPLSKYVMLIFECRPTCWPSHGLVPLSASMWCC